MQTRERASSETWEKVLSRDNFTNEKELVVLVLKQTNNEYLASHQLCSLQETQHTVSSKGLIVKADTHWLIFGESYTFKSCHFKNTIYLKQLKCELTDELLF